MNFPHLNIQIVQAQGEGPLFWFSRNTIRAIVDGYIDALGALQKKAPGAGNVFLLERVDVSPSDKGPDRRAAPPILIIKIHGNPNVEACEMPDGVTSEQIKEAILAAGKKLTQNLVDQLSQQKDIINKTFNAAAESVEIFTMQ